MFKRYTYLSWSVGRNPKTKEQVRNSTPDIVFIGTEYDNRFFLAQIGTWREVQLISETPVTNEEAFLYLCETHDLCYDYSDSYAVWAQGMRQRERINDLATQIGIAAAARIWNAMIDRKIDEAARRDFYWPEKDHA